MLACGGAGRDRGRVCVELLRQFSARPLAPLNRSRPGPPKALDLKSIRSKKRTWATRAMQQVHPVTDVRRQGGISGRSHLDAHGRPSRSWNVEIQKSILILSKKHELMSSAMSRMCLSVAALLAMCGAIHASQTRNEDKICISPAIGLERKSDDDPQRFPIWGKPFGIECDGQGISLRLSVTHENINNSHIGSRNYDPNIVAYMSDFDFERDFGRWIHASVHRRKGSPVVSLRLNTIDFDEDNYMTGWRLRNGHLFVGLNDTRTSFTLDNEARIELDFRILKNTIGQSAKDSYSGRRVLIGAVAKWNESPPRTNTDHFLEINIDITNGYSFYYNEKPRLECEDRSYDRCFYSDTGRSAEGREIRYMPPLSSQQFANDLQAWTHLKIPLAATYRNLPWASRPDSWNRAIVTGVYIGIESIGATDTEIELMNYRVADMP